MKLKLNNRVLIMALLCAVTLTASAQDPAPPAPIPAPEPSLIQAGAQIASAGRSFFEGANGATNWSASPYITYFPNSKHLSPIGGGVFVSYHLNNLLAAGLGVDEMGGVFTMPSGNVTLKYDLKPLSRFGFTNFTVTPFALAGLATPIGGGGSANGGIATITGLGGTTRIGSFKGFDLGTGLAMTKWTGAGSYSGNRYQLFLTISHKF